MSQLVKTKRQANFNYLFSTRSCINWAFWHSWAKTVKLKVVSQLVVYLTSSCVNWGFFGTSGPV
jgi:hypothetical protein